MNYFFIKFKSKSRFLRLVLLLLSCSDSLFSYQHDGPHVSCTSNLPQVHMHLNNHFMAQKSFVAPLPFLPNVTKTKKQTQAEFEKYVTTTTQQYLHAGVNFFCGDINKVAPAIRAAIANKTIEQPAVQDNLKRQVITHLVMTGQTDGGKVIPYKNYPWMQIHDLNATSLEDQAKINYLISRVKQESNDTTVELVQAGLQAWEQAQQATNFHEKSMHQNKYETCYHTLTQHVQPSKMAGHAPKIQNDEFIKLLDVYACKIDEYHALRNVGMQYIDSTYFARLKDRKQALLDSQKELFGQLSQENRNYKIDPQTLGFMQAYNINYACFDNDGCSRFQHCITNEIVTLLKTSADMAYRNKYEPIITQFAQHTSNLAVSAQQLNQLAHLEQALTLLDCAHFFVEYGQIILDHDFQIRQWKDLCIPMVTGIARALYKWAEFGKKLYEDPHKTIGKLSNDFYEVAQCLYTIAAEIGRFTPAAYLDDMTRDMQDGLNSIRHRANHPPDSSSSRMMQRSEQNLQTLQTGLYQSLHLGQAVIGAMMEKPWQDNIADIAELTTDGFITQKATQCLLYLSQCVGSQLLQAGSEIQQHIPPHLLDSSMTFMKTDAGHLIAVADTTGENIAGAIAAQALKIAESSTPFFQFAPQAKILADKIEELTHPNKAEVAAFQKSLEPYLRTDKIVNIERLKSIEGVDQINKFKDYTNNFTNLDKLHPDEILYLNLCDWLEPQAAAINAKLKKVGGLKIIDKVSGQQVLIEEFDIFHSLLGEMKPGSVRSTTSGGHCFLTELRASSLTTGEIKSFGNGFFDMQIKPSRGLSANYKDQTYFPAGKSINNCTDIIIDAINNPQSIKYIIPEYESTQQAFLLTNQKGQPFMLRIEKNIAQFHPWNPINK